jgi:tetratricopeptide (TPR) repeat protein
MTILSLRLPLALTLLGLGLTVAPACKKKDPVPVLDVTQVQNPVAIFQNGVDLLRTPDPKTGDINYTLAYQRFTESANLQPNAKVHFNAAWTAEKLNDLANAEKHYKAAYELDKSYDKAMFSYTRVLTATGKKAEAVAVFKAALDAKPSDLELRSEYMQALINNAQYTEAENEAQEILRQDPANVAAYRALSSMYFAQNKLGMSQLCSEKALSINDKDPGIYNNMGVTYVFQKDEERAIERFKTAIQIDPKNFEANMNLGFIALDSGDYGLALTSFQSATAANPSSIDAKLGLAVALRGTGDLEGAEILYREILSKDPDNEHAYFNAVVLYARYTKDIHLAEAYLKALIARQTGKPAPKDEARILRTEASIQFEKRRLAERANAMAAALKRQEQAQNVLNELAAMVAEIETRAPDCRDPAAREMVNMTLEQAILVVAENDAAMAGDVMPFVEDALLQLDECPGTAVPNVDDPP